MKSYKSYKFSDSEYNGTTITNMIEHYWSNISNQTYGIASFLNSSNAFSGTYYKHDNNNGFIIFSGQSPSYKTQKGIMMNGNWTWTSLVTNTDLPTRIKPIEVNGYSGQTFKSVLKDKCDNSINFVVFRSNASNPITDNPFSFVNGYAIVFNSIALAPSNSLMILGTSDGNNAVIESRRLDLR